MISSKWHQQYTAVDTLCIWCSVLDAEFKHYFCPCCLAVPSPNMVVSQTHQAFFVTIHPSTHPLRKPQTATDQMGKDMTRWFQAHGGGRVDDPRPKLMRPLVHTDKGTRVAELNLWAYAERIFFPPSIITMFHEPKCEPK